MATQQTASAAISPLADRVVIRVLAETGQTRGGLHIPESVKEKPRRGEVLAVGPGRFEKDKRIPMGVDVGAIVLYAGYTGDEVTINGERLLILRESDVLAIVN